MTPCDLEKIKERRGAESKAIGFMDWTQWIFEDEGLLIAEVEALRQKVKMMSELTVADFQERVRDLVIERSKAPDSAIDGAGCDSGDWEDFTLTEISQGFNFVDERIDALRSKLDGAKEGIAVIHARTILAVPQTQNRDWVPNKCVELLKELEK
jgi:hypothetical protein